MFYNNTQEEFIGKEILRIREICGPKGRVIGAVSGGVDSTVAAKLMHEAIGDRYDRFPKKKRGKKDQYRLMYYLSKIPCHHGRLRRLAIKRSATSKRNAQ